MLHKLLLSVGLLLWCVAAIAGTPSQYYVDPAAGNDTTGNGSLGTPWATVQHALNTITRDTTNGDQINLKAGTDDTLAAALDLSTYGTPGDNTPLIIRGYTSAANDGGKGGIDCAASYSLFAVTTLDYVALIDLHIHNAGSANIVVLDQYCGVIGCEVGITTGNGISVGLNSQVLGCHVHTITGVAVLLKAGGACASHNYIKGSEANKPSAGIDFNNVSNGTAQHNIISISGTSSGIINMYHGSIVAFNSVLSAGGSGLGIERNANSMNTRIENNLVEGFSSVGGTGIDDAGGRTMCTVAGNAVYNCVTKYDLQDSFFVEDNEELDATPFTKATGGASDTFAERFDYFSPVAAVQGGAYPDGCRRDKGAVQHADPAATGGETSHVWVR